MTYLLDTNIVLDFFQTGHENELALAAQGCSMALVEEVRRELGNSLAAQHAYRNWLSTSNIAVRSIEVGSDASVTLAKLLAIKKHGIGERASIALAAFDKALTFVTNDRGAMKLALHELWLPGERVLSVPVFLRRLFDGGHLKHPVVLDDIISISLTSATHPTWWASWRAQL